MALIAILPALLKGAEMTLEVTLLAAVIGLILSFLSALASLSRLKVVAVANRIYVEVFRGTSLLVQLFFLFYVLPTLGVSMTPFVTAVVALSLNASSYGSEVIRSALLAIDRGQLDAAASLNMGAALALRRVVLPQAVQIATPPLVNQLVQLLLSTSLVSLVAVTDLAFTGQQLLTTTGRPTIIYTIVLVLYFALAYPLSYAAQRLEHHRSAPKRPWEII